MIYDIPNDNQTRAKFNAYIGLYPHWGYYLAAYKKAFEVLIKEIYDTGHHVDHLSYPILFIARHCLELGFKDNIRYFSKYSKKNDFKNAGHNLESLFKAFKLHIKETIQILKENYKIKIDKDDMKDFEDYCNEVEKLTYIFHSLDENSDRFRYPLDKNDNNSFDYKKTINLIDIIDLFKKSMVLLEFTKCLFEKYTDYIDEIQE